MTVGIYDLLPLVLRVRDLEASGLNGDDPILKRVIDAVQGEMDVTTALIKGMRLLLSPALTGDLTLALLANQLGVSQFPFSEVENNPREYVRTLDESHKIKGTLLSIIREMKYRNIAEGVRVWELVKTVINAVDEYTIYEGNLGTTSYRSARVIFVEDVYGDAVRPASPAEHEPGVYSSGQIPYAEAKLWWDRLANVSPIHVFVPPKITRQALDDSPNTISDENAGHIYATFNDSYTLEQDSLVILTNCTSNCQASCQTRCEVLCEGSCQSSCEKSCQAKCEGACQSDCQSFCQGGCEQSCEDPCQAHCQTSCEAACQGTCEYVCEQTCEATCETAAETCQNKCELHCQTGTEIQCTTTCELACQFQAQQPCPDKSTPIK